MSKVLLAIFFSLMLFKAEAQCSIVSSDIVCREELMSFDVTASGGISSVSWDMGDGTTSTQKSFSHKYSTRGAKIVKVTINLTGGGTCVASKKVTVYEHPKIKITQKKDNIYCWYQNKVCLVDSSSGGDSGVVIKKRIVIWDDGSQSIDNYPKKGDMACHSFYTHGTYKVIIQLISDKDCKSDTVINIVILQDLVPEILVFSIDNNNTKLRYCDSARTEFWDVRVKDTSNIISRTYDWGDGSPKIQTKSVKLSHFYKKSGFYKVSLSYLQKNGCFTTKDTLIEVTVYSVKFNINKNAYKQCLGAVFRYTQSDLIWGGFYKWFMDDTLQNMGIPIIEQFERKVIDFTPEPGKHFISLEIYNQGCIKMFKYDSLEVIGIKLDAYALNDNQCDGKDTVYYKVDVKSYGVGKLAYFWDFDDPKAPQCTTSRVKGINVNDNCNFATDSVGKHKYVKGVCRTWKIFIKDLQSGLGCDVDKNGVINTIKPDSIKIGVLPMTRFCVGDKVDYYMAFTHNICPSVKVQINLDSACDKDRWSIRFINWTSYKKTCSKDGWVTVGIAITYGSPVIYTGFNMKKDFYIDSGRVCHDTIWKHNWFRLGSDPLSSFDPKPHCIKELIRPVVLDSIQKDIAFSVWSWGDNSKADTVFMKKGDSVIRAPAHVYKKTGNYVIMHRIENESMCYSTSISKIILGFNMSVDYDPIICPGSLVLFKDSMCYRDSMIVAPYEDRFSKNFWHIPKRKQQGREEFKWNFDDGRGFVTDTANPVIKFPKIGDYKVSLAAKDSLNCWDTLTKLVHVGGVHAGIRKITGKILCDGIIQLYDSSYSDYKPPLDSIIKFYWEFGDGGNPSYFRNPIHHYNAMGEYTIFQQVENSKGCRDTAYIKIKTEGPEASFEIAGDSVGCAPFTAEFKNTSIRTSDFIWFFGDSLKSRLSTRRDTNVRFTYTKPGIYYISLFGSDSVVNPNNGNIVYYCKTFFPDTTLPNHPVRKIVVLKVHKAAFGVDSIQCVNRSIVVNDKSDSIYKTYKWVIPGIDSITTANKTGTLNSKDSGLFNIKFMPSYPGQAPYFKSCPDTVSKKVRITQINSEFDIFKDTTSCPVFTFTNNTKSFKSIKWNLGDSLAADNIISGENKVIHTYKSKTGKFYPCLYSENFYGCTDTLCREVNVEIVSKLIIPNVFTPGNDDKLNDVFEIVASGVDEYDLSIFNRWGQMVFHTDKDGSGNDGNNWTGKSKNGSNLYPDGTYFYIFKYKFNCEDEKHDAHGVITLIGVND